MRLPFLCFAATCALGATLGGCSDADVPGTTETPEAAQLAPPPQGQGVQWTTGVVAVDAGQEVQECHFYRVSELAALGGLPVDQPFNLNRIEIGQRDGSHHMNIFRVRTIATDTAAPFEDFETNRVQRGVDGKGACFVSPNWADWPLIANSQLDGQLDWTYPAGVVNELQPDEWLMLQTHYVNATSQDTPDGYGEVFVNFWNAPASEVVHQMGTVFATKQSIRICRSQPKPSFDGSCQVKSEEPVTVIGANGHFHSRGKQFRMYAWDGKSTSPSSPDPFYISDKWDEPPMDHSPDLVQPLVKDGGIFYSCDFQWREPDASVGCAGLDAIDRKKMEAEGKSEAEIEAALDCCYRFGPIVEENEHCNVFAYYYPASDDVICF
jgi:hypothetical protein